MKLESCGWSPMKAYFKSFNFVFLIFFLDHGKGINSFFEELDLDLGENEGLLRLGVC